MVRTNRMDRMEGNASHDIRHIKRQISLFFRKQLNINERNKTVRFVTKALPLVWDKTL